MNDDSKIMSKIAQIELEQEKVLAADRADARKAGTLRDDNADIFVRRFTYRYAYFITIMTFIFITLAVFLPAFFSDPAKALPQSSWQIINTVVGFLLGVGLSAIIQYFYGSSMGSKDKANWLKANQSGQGGKS